MHEDLLSSAAEQHETSPPVCLLLLLLEFVPSKREVVSVKNILGMHCNKVLH